MHINHIDNDLVCQYSFGMTLNQVLKILDKDEATEIAKCGKSASWHWYQKGIRRKVPGMPILVSWADHLELSDADLGELIRDSQSVRIEIFELLAQGGDNRRIKTRSNLRRDLAKEIADELDSRRSSEREEQRQLDSEKEHILRVKKEQSDRLHERRARLDAYKEQLDKIRRNNGDY